MPEEKNIILTQKIRNPKPEAENKWINVLQVDNDEKIFINAVVTTGNLEDNSITYDKMYKDDGHPDLKPVGSNTIQDGAIQNAAMYQETDKSVKENGNIDNRPVSTNTIQTGAIIDSKIENETITMRKIKEPIAYPVQLIDNNDDYKIIFYSHDGTNPKMNNKTIWEEPVVTPVVTI